MDWMIWIIIGIVCLIIEIFTPGFFFASIGTGSIITGLIAVAKIPVHYQWIIFVVITGTIFLLLRKFAKFILRPDDKESNVFALAGKKGIVTKVILPNKRGYVKIEGEEWSAVATDPAITITEGTVVEIVQTEGNKVLVSLVNSVLVNGE